MELENAKASLLYTSSHYPFYNVVSFGVHRGELHIRISSEPNRDEKRKFYPISYGITAVSYTHLTLPTKIIRMLTTLLNSKKLKTMLRGLLKPSISALARPQLIRNRCIR